MKKVSGPSLSDHEKNFEQVGKHKIYAFKDAKSLAYGPPLTMETRGAFIRWLQERIAENQAIWAKHPEDFTVFELGEYDIRSGSVELYEAKNCLGLVQDFRQSLGEKQ